MLQEIKAHLRAIEGELERLELEGYVYSCAFRRMVKQARILRRTIRRLERIR